MNVKEYISNSGIIESYVLGLASEAERAEFEQLCAQYPEIVAARIEFEEKIEKQAAQKAQLPPPMVKVKILEAIGMQDARPQSSSNPPKVITMENVQSPAKSASGWLRFVAAASVILLIGLAWFSYQSYTRNNDLQRTNTALQANLTTKDSILNEIVKETKIVRDPNVTVVNMVGTKVAPRSSANIYWDSTSTNVFLVVKNMPKLPNESQYQLWALIDGKKDPMDLGVFDAKDNNVILKMKNTQKAAAFAITIEQKGGSHSPTLEKMQSLGKTMQTQ